LIRRYPDRHAYQKNLAEITNVLGYAYYKRGRHDEALQSFREVQNICNSVSKQVTVGPKPLWLLNLLALSHSNIAWIHQEKGENQAALRDFEQALSYRSALVDSHPSVSDYKVKLGVSCREIAGIQHASHQDAKAFQSAERSIDVLKALVRAQPAQAGYHGELGLSWNYLGILYDHTGKHTEALAAFEKAVAEQQLAVDVAKENDDYRAYLANHLDNLGEQFVDLGRAGEALSLHRRAVEIFRDLTAAHPEQRSHLLECLKSMIRLGTVDRLEGDSVAALESFTAARTIVERRSSAAPEDPALRVMLGAVLDREATALLDQGLAEEAQSRLERALVLLRRETDRATSGQENAHIRQSRQDVLHVLGLEPATATVGFAERWCCSEALANLARVLRAKKLFAEAGAADAQRAVLWKRHPPSELVDVALRQLDGALVIGLGKTPVSDRARAVRELELAKAADSLGLAVTEGFNDLRKIRSHPGLQFLLARKNLEVLFMDMAFPAQPFANH
jgi:tetratricopeptide (TPR) repeat protein